MCSRPCEAALSSLERALHAKEVARVQGLPRLLPYRSRARLQNISIRSLLANFAAVGMPQAAHVILRIASVPT
jgi:hypothetical protein